MIVFGSSEGAEGLQLLDAFSLSGLELALVVVEDGASILAADAQSENVADGLAAIAALL